MRGLTDGVFLRVVGLPFQRRLLPGVAALFAAVVLADPMIDWHYLRERLQDTSPGSLTVMLLVPLIGWSWLAGEALAPLWELPTMRYLRRQPLGHWRWTRYLLPSLLPSLAPVAALYWLAPTNGVIGMTAWGSAVLILTLARSRSGICGLRWVLIGSVTLAIVVGAMLMLGPWVAWAVAIAPLILLPLATADIVRQPSLHHRLRTSRHRAATPTLALLHRDAICLWRRERGRLLQLWLLAPAAGAFLFALRVNGGFEDRDLFRAACVLQFLALASVYDVLVRLGTHLAGELFRRHWPITTSQRAQSLGAIAVLLSTPSTIAIVLGAGAVWQATHVAAWLCFTASSLIALLALWTSTGRHAAGALGWSLWIWLVNTLLAATLPLGIYLALSLSLLLGSWHLTRRALDRVAERAATSPWESKADG